MNLQMQQTKHTQSHKDSLDSQDFGEIVGEIIYDKRQHLGIKNKIILWISFVFLIFGFYSSTILIFAGHYDLIPVMLCLLVFCVLLLYVLLYFSGNRFFVTEKGIGFTRRHRFKTQRLFFYFGEVGIRHSTHNIYDFTYRFTHKPPMSLDIFLLFPLNARVVREWGIYRIQSKIKWRVMLVSAEKAYMSPKIREVGNLKDYILEKTKEAVKMEAFDSQDDFKGDSCGDLPNNVRKMKVKCFEPRYFQGNYIIFGETLGESSGELL